jgi:hypothetical protein
MKTYKVIADIENVYLPNTIITSDTLINDYLRQCKGIEDADLIGWLHTLKEANTDNSIAQAVAFIADAWDIQLEEIKENK